MISLGGLVSQRAFGKFEMGKVISNPFANAFIKEAEGEDHEVSMANNSLDTIIKMATELKAKMGENEKDIPAWIQDHITNAENFISQASSNYHEYGQNESRIAEDKGPCWKGYKQVGMKDKGGRQVPNCVPNESVVNEDINAFETLMLIRNLEQTNKLLVQDLKTSKGLSNNKKENIKKSIAINQSLINHYKEILKNLKNNESVVNEEPAKSTGEKIQNLNNRIKALKDKMAATKSSEQKNLIQQRLKNALQSLSNYKKQNISKESVSEGVSSADMDKIKGAVEAAKSFMNVGAELKKLGMKYTFATEPLAIYIIQPTPNNKVAIVNKKYVSKPDFVVGDIAVGVMEGKSVTEASGRVPQIFLKTGAVEKKIKELMADRKKAVVPYNTEKDPAKKESLKQILIKLTKQIQGYEKNLVQLRDKEEEYIQQMQADAELDTSAFD